MKGCSFLKCFLYWLLILPGTVPHATAEQQGQRGAQPAAGT